MHYIHSAVFLPLLLQVPSPFSCSSPPDQLLLCFLWGMEEKSKPPRDIHLAWPKKIQKTGTNLHITAECGSPVGGKESQKEAKELETPPLLRVAQEHLVTEPYGICREPSSEPYRVHVCFFSLCTCSHQLLHVTHPSNDTWDRP